MFRLLVLTALLGVACAANADGPGSRIRIGPPEPQHPSPAAKRDLERCERMRDEEKDRCMKQARAAAAADERTRGPESVGGTPAGSGATSGTSGGGSFGGSAPR